jgi:DNA-binding NarL/FixJ family response regulator
LAIRVLVVDDVPDLRMMFRLALEFDDRFEVVGEASDGIEAIEQARTLRPDVIMLDLAMPRMDGLEAIPLLHQATPGVRILVLSGFDSKNVIEQAISSCATAYLQKGVPAEEIADTLHEVHLSPPKKVCPQPS